MLVRLQMTDTLIYAKLDKTERVSHLASKNQIRVDTCYAILHEIEARGDYQITWGFADDGHQSHPGFPNHNLRGNLNENQKRI